MRTNIGFLREDLKKAGAKPEDIGTTEEELIKFEKKSALASARTWLARARVMAERENVKIKINFVIEDLAKAGAKPEDIGTSKEELERLSKKW